MRAKPRGEGPETLFVACMIDLARSARSVRLDGAWSTIPRAEPRGDTVFRASLLRAWARGGGSKRSRRGVPQLLKRACASTSRSKRSSTPRTARKQLNRVASAWQYLHGGSTGSTRTILDGSKLPSRRRRRSNLSSLVSMFVSMFVSPRRGRRTCLAMVSELEGLSLGSSLPVHPGVHGW